MVTRGNFNDYLDKGEFPKCLKLADPTLVVVKGLRTLKSKYRPVSCLPVLSKLFETLTSKHFSEIFESILSKFQCGFRKGCSAEHCLLIMLEMWIEATYDNNAFGLLLTGLSKAFDCLSQDLLITKLHAQNLKLFG